MEYKYSGTKLKIGRIPYYFSTLFTLLKAMKPFTQIPFMLHIFFRRDICVTLRKNNLSFKVKTLLDELTLKEVVVDEEYESYGVKIEDSDKVVIDIGAGFGDFTVLSAKRHPQAKIFAFEPDQSYFSLLQKNVSINRVGNVIMFNKAVTSLSQLLKTIQ